MGGDQESLTFLVQIQFNILPFWEYIFFHDFGRKNLQFSGKS